MQCSSRSNCEIYETVFRSRLHSNTIACQRIGISRPCGNTHAETYRISRLSGQFQHVLNMTVPRKIGTLLHMQPGIKTCLIRNELVSEHRATAVTFGIHITVHRRDQSRDISWAACAAKPIDTMRKHMMPIRIVQTVRRSLQRIHIVILLAIKADARDGTIEQLTLKHVGIFTIRFQQKHLAGKHAHRHRSARFAIHGVVRQIVIVRERLPHMCGTDRTRYIHAFRHDVVPKTMRRIQQALITGNTRHMCDSSA